ncbi:MAG: hypothetical protein K6E88_00120 [Lachnospiraceae bacterium]|nr:hypothetical protein [Lachnospiraceae bacterium]
MSLDSLPNTYAVGDRLPAARQASGQSTNDDSNAIYVEISDPELAKLYEFDGWYTSAGNEKVVVAQSEGGDLYPKVKERTYTVRIQSTFKEAGRLVFPENDSLWPAGVTYSYSQDEGVNAVIVSGLHYNDQFTLPQPLNPFHPEGEGVLHIEGAYDYMSTEATPLYCGAGVGRKDENGIVDIVDDINVARVLLGDEQYIEQISERFVSYVDYEDDDHENYLAPISIGEDLSIYCYFAIPVSLNVEDEQEDDVEFGRMMTSSSVSSPILDVIKTKDGYVASEENWIINLKPGTNNKPDQYWSISNRNNQWEFATYYYGKQLDIPAFDYQNANKKRTGYYSQYKVKHLENDFSETDTTVTYCNEAGSDEAYAVRFEASGATSGFPYDSWMSQGSLMMSTIEYDLSLREFAFLDLSDPDINVSLGDSYLKVIRTSKELSTDIYKTTSISEYIPSSFINKIFVPEDGLYDWENGGKKWISTGYEEVKNERFMISKAGYKLAGYEISLYHWDDTPYTQFPVAYDYIIHSSDDDHINDITYADGEALAFAPCIDNLKYVLKPIFVPEVPFSIKLVRETGHIVRTSSDDNLMKYYNVEISLNGPADADGTPFVTEIDLHPYFVKGYNYTSGQTGSYTDVGFQSSVKWNADNHVYDLYNGNIIWRSIVPINGKILIKLEDLIGEQFNEMQYVRGIELVADNTETTEDESVTHYRIRIMGEEDCGRSAPAANPTFDDYYPWKSHIEVDPNAPFAFTGVYDKQGDNVSIAAIFSEVNDTLDNLLLTVSGETDKKEVWYGGTLTDIGDYGSGCFVVEYDNEGRVTYDELCEIFPWTVTRASTGGSASKAIKGNLAAYPRQNDKYVDENGLLYDFGCGILVFERYAKLYINPNHMDNVLVYPHADNCYLAIKDDALDLKAEGLPSDYSSRIKTVTEFRYSNRDSFSFRLDDECPEGWVHIENGDNVDGYIYVGTNEEIAGRLIMGEHTGYFVPFIPA